MKSPSYLSLKESCSVFWCLFIHMDVTLTINFVFNLSWLMKMATEMHLRLIKLVRFLMIVGLIDNRFDPVVLGLLFHTSV